MKYTACTLAVPLVASVAAGCPLHLSNGPDRATAFRSSAVLEEKVNTKHAEYETAIERMNAAFERLRVDMANRDRENAIRDRENAERATERDKENAERAAERDRENAERLIANQRWVMALVIGGTGIIVAAIALL